MEQNYMINTWLKHHCTEDRHQAKTPCAASCFQKVFHKYCNCSFEIAGKMSFFSPPWYTPTCTPIQNYLCFENYKQQFQDVQVKCSASCLQPCYSVTYRKQYSSALFELNDVNLSDDTVGSLISIYYDSFEITVTREINTMTFASVLANVGGAMGVFIGASLMSLVEIAILICDLIRGVCSSNMSKIDVR